MDVGNFYMDGNADAVEFCSHDSFEHLLAASTYVLGDGEQPSRSGSISLFEVDAIGRRLELIHTVKTAGIFDLKWNPVNPNTSPLLAQADADGYIRLYRLPNLSDASDIHVNSLKEVENKKVSSSMCLCLDWKPSGTSMAVGLSDGSVSIISLDESGPNIVQELRKVHDFELWTTCFDIHQPQLLYSGSDDCKFKCWDLRTDPSELAFQNSKTHTMGVCSIVKDPNDPNTLVTGSYDEYLRVWDMRSISKPVNEASIGLGGGVWKIKYHPSVHGIVAAACMHNGFSVVSVKSGALEVVESYKKHESLAYGVDWKKGESKISVLATCSFYDRLLGVWIPENDVVSR
jgi:diphthamide biosynthesis protein 7